MKAGQVARKSDHFELTGFWGNDMKSLFVGTVALLSILFTGAFEITQAEDLFPDKALEAVVRHEVFEKRKSTEPLVAEDVANISTIKGRAKGIKNLKGLEACRSLASLDLAGNEIEDLAPLTDLKKIQYLELGKNKIQNIDPLKTLVALQYVGIEDNTVTDISPLKGIKSLVNLYADNNQITDLSALGESPKMVSIYIKNNKVTDLAPLAQLPWLERLDVSGNGVTDISALTSLTEWRYLFLMRNQITDLTSLLEMSKKDMEGEKRFAPFWNVYLAENPLSEESQQNQLPELRKTAKTVDLEYNN